MSDKQPAAPKKADKKKTEKNLVPMTDGFTTIAVNPACVAAHQRRGWRVVEG